MFEPLKSSILGRALDKIQKATDDGIAKIDAELKAKEAEVMAV